MVPTPYETYSPKSLANIRGLEDVIGNRCKPTIIKKSKNPDIVNREVDSTKEAWGEIRNQLYLLFLTHWPEVRKIYEEINEMNTIEKIFSEHSVGSEHKSNKSYLENIELVVGRILELWKPILTLSIFFDLQGFWKISTLHTLTSLNNNKNTENLSTPTPVCSLTSTQPTLDLTYKMVGFAVSHAKQKKLDDATETGVSILVQSLLKLVTDDSFYSLTRMKTEMLNCYDEEQKWITNRWIGGALKRLGFTEKRRTGKGTEYRLTKADVKDLAERMEIDVEKGPPQTVLKKLKDIRSWILENKKNGLVSVSDLNAKILESGLEIPKINQQLLKEGFLFKVTDLNALGVAV